MTIASDKISPAAKIKFRTNDGMIIIGDWYQGKPDAPAALLLHMMPAVRGSWRVFAEKLVAVGWSALAIDERGHGESTVGVGRQLDYRSMSDEHQQEKIRDVEAAVEWLDGQRIPKSRVALVGASIGANLAIVYAAKNPEIRATVALSPGLDYHGVTTEDKVGQFQPGQKLFLAVSAEDERSSVAVRSLRILKSGAESREFHGAGHGTRMFEAVPELMDEIIDWLRRSVK